VAAFRKAGQLFEKLALDRPNEPQHRFSLASCHYGEGMALGAARQPARAATAYRKAISLYRQLIDEGQPATTATLSLGGAYCNLANCLKEVGKEQSALVAYGRAIATLEKLLEKVSGHVQATQFLANSHWGRAVALHALKRYADALKDWDRALELGRRGNPLLRLGHAGTLARLGEHVKATAEAEEMAGRKGATGTVLYDAACVFAVASGTGKEGKPVKEADRYARRAVELLDRARQAGFFKLPGQVAQLKKDPDLAAIRGREDFRTLLAGLEKSGEKADR
jgi:tetratricopeptide (TPR) repeat protein